MMLAPLAAEFETCSSSALGRCVECGIIVFRSEAQAQVAGVPFYAHINGRVGDKCTGCATGNPFIGLRTEKKIGDVMNNQNQELVLKVETGVAPGKKICVSKYDVVYDVVDQARFGEWIRIQMPDIKTARGAKVHFRKLEKAGRLPFVLETSARSDKNGLAWLYARKEVKEGTSE